MLILHLLFFLLFPGQFFVLFVVSNCWHSPIDTDATSGSIPALGQVFCWPRSGNTVWGCSLCLVATSQYSIIAIITSKCLKEDCPLTKLLALEGLMSLVTLALILATTLAIDNSRPWPIFPEVGTTIFMCVTNMMLNFGWLSFTSLMGAAQAAMAACFSMPISLLLDALMLHSLATSAEAGWRAGSSVCMFL